MKQYVSLLLPILVVIIDLVIILVKFSGDERLVPALITIFLPLLPIYFPNVFSQLSRIGFSARLASDFADGLPPYVSVILGWIALIGISIIIIVK